MTSSQAPPKATSQGLERWTHSLGGLINRRWSWPWIALVLLLGTLLALDLARVWRITNHKDLRVFVAAAQRLAAGEDIYQDAGPFRDALESGRFSMLDETVIWPYAYAPTVALLFRPVLGFSQTVIQTVWWTTNACAMLLGSWLSARALDRSCSAITPAYVLLLLVVLYRYDPAVVTLRLGQIEIVQFLLLAITLYALTRDRARDRWESIGGVSLGLATALKFFPGALILLLVWRKRWRPALWALSVSMVAILSSFALVGWQSLVSYMSFAGMYGLGGAFAAFPYNQSLNGLMSRNLVENVFGPTLKGWHLPALASALTLSASFVVVAASAWLTWHREGWPDHPTARDDAGFALEYGLGVVALLLVSPHSQVYAYVWAAIPIICLGTWLIHHQVASGEEHQRAQIGWWQWAGLGISYLLIGRHYVLFHPGLTRLVQSHYLFGGVALWITMGLTLTSWRRGASQKSCPEPTPDQLYNPKEGTEPVGDEPARRSTV